MICYDILQSINFTDHHYFLSRIHYCYQLTPSLFRFKAKHKGEPAGIFKASSGFKPVKTNTIVKSEQSKHG